MEFAGQYLEDAGISDVQFLGRDSQRPNVVATIGAGSPVVVLNGHLDIVVPGDRRLWNSDPYEPVIQDGRLIGRGSVDMKGACAAMMLAVCALDQHRESWTGTVQLQLVCDEEDQAYFGTPYLVELMKLGQLPRPDHVIVGEYSGLQVMTAERGTFKFWMHFHGRATHTATARVEGHNAIYAAAEAVRLLEEDLNISHPAVGQAVMSVNQIRGGTFYSQVPDTCTIQVDRRLVPGETMESALEHASARVESLRGTIPWLEFEATPCLDDYGRPRYSPANLTRFDAPVVEAIRHAHQRVTGKPAEDFDDWFGATDGRCFRLEGIDCVIYGPAGSHAHGPNEYVVLDSLDTQLAVVANAVLELCRASSVQVG